MWVNSNPGVQRGIRLMVTGWQKTVESLKTKVKWQSPWPDKVVALQGVPGTPAALVRRHVAAIGSSGLSSTGSHGEGSQISSGGSWRSAALRQAAEPVISRGLVATAWRGVEHDAGTVQSKGLFVMAMTPLRLPPIATLPSLEPSLRLPGQADSLPRRPISRRSAEAGGVRYASSR